MPYTYRKIRKTNCYKVFNTKTKKIFSNCATKNNAIKQLKLLHALQFNKNFIRKTKSRKNIK